MTATIRWKGWTSLTLGAWLCGWWLLSPYPVNEATATMVGALVAAFALWHLYDEIGTDDSDDQIREAYNSPTSLPEENQPCPIPISTSPQRGA